MKKRLLAIILAVMLIAAVLPAGVFTVTAENYTIAQLRNKFPEGKYWNHYVSSYNECADVLWANKNNSFCDSVTDIPCDQHGVSYTVGHYDCNVGVLGNRCGEQCLGFALRLADLAYGGYPYCNVPDTTNVATAKAMVKPGDVITYNYSGSNNGHTVFVIGVSGNNISVAECNYGYTCMIHWDRVLSFDEIWSISLYSAPYALSGDSPTATFENWENDKYTYVGETDAAIGQAVNTSGGTCSEIGMILYDINGNQLGKACDPPSATTNKYYYKINEELKCYLSPGTSYKYRFYAIVGGETKYSDIKTFTTKGSANPAATFEKWENDNYTYIRETDAAIGQVVYTSGGVCSEVGMTLYDINGNQLGSASDSPSTETNKYYYKINEELHCQLTPGTDYKYKFFAVVGGKTIYSNLQTFKTTGTSNPSVTFEKWNSENYTYIHDTDASIGQAVYVSGGTWSEVGIILYDSNENQLGTTGNVPVTSINYYYFKMNDELKCILNPNTKYKYKFYTVVGGVTFYSNMQEFTTTGETIEIPDNPSEHNELTWTDKQVFPSKKSAFISISANATEIGVFTKASLKLWNDENVLIAQKQESINTTLKTLPIWYSVYTETGVLLEPSKTYKFQISATYNDETYSSPIYSFNTESTSSKCFGIDVSSHQGIIDWETVSQYIDFAIIRCGYGSNYTVNDDTKWQYNISECERLGIPYGVYLYSYAENGNEALSEAQHVIRLLEGHNPTLPIYYDLEDANTVALLSNSQILTQSRIFCEEIKNAGYIPGIYASQSWWETKLTSSTYDLYEKWVAAYGGMFAPQSANWSLWQYSSSGHIPGISVNVDLNYLAVSLHDPTVADGHNYSSAWSRNSISHWHKCLSCGAETARENHIYDNDQDTTCNICGYTRSVTNPVSETDFQITVENKKMVAGREFTVAVEINNNPGFSYLEVTPVYSDGLTLVSADNGTLISDFTKGKQYIWTADNDVTADGKLMTFTFTTSEELAPGDYQVGFIVRTCVNYAEDTVALAVKPGNIQIIDFIYGDANEDNIINGQDVVRLKKYLANYDYDIGLSSINIGPGADTNGDGVVNGQDVVRLKKYLANYDYDTETSTVVLGPQG